ncbi:MAG: VPLPA-CTERM sorting domain-containing protein [Pseudomonadota bacterium]
MLPARRNSETTFVTYNPFDATLGDLVSVEVSASIGVRAIGTVFDDPLEPGQGFTSAEGRFAGEAKVSILSNEFGFIRVSNRFSCDTRGGPRFGSAGRCAEGASSILSDVLDASVTFSAAEWLSFGNAPVAVVFTAEADLIDGARITTRFENRETTDFVQSSRLTIAYTYSTLAPPPPPPPPAPVPLPATGWLLLVGVGGLIAVRKRRA